MNPSEYMISRIEASAGRSRLTLAEQWTDIELRLPKELSLSRRKDMKRAFFMGAQLVLFMTFDLGGREDLSEDQAIQHLEQWHRECDKFGLEMLRGKA